jgi:type II secretory pathway pseudopilin PulG
MTRRSIATRTPGDRAAEGGYILLSVMFLVALLTLSVSMAMPRIIQEVKRDKELECVQRGKQYIGAIQLFYRQTGNFPTDLSQLENTSNMRFLRKRYLDPITNSNWKPVYQGEVKAALLQSSHQLFGVQTSSYPQGSTTSVPTPGLGIDVPGGPSSYGGQGGVTVFLNPFQNPSSADAGTPQPSAAVSATGAASDLSTAPIANRRIVGVASLSTRSSIRVYKKQTHYNDWQFIYDPSTDGLVGASYAGVNNAVQGANPSAISPIAAPSQPSPPPASAPAPTPD